MRARRSTEFTPLLGDHHCERFLGNRDYAAVALLPASNPVDCIQILGRHRNTERKLTRFDAECLLEARSRSPDRRRTGVTTESPNDALCVGRVNQKKVHVHF